MARDSHFFEGLILGTIAGAIGAVLFTPCSGAETRQRLRDLRQDKEDILNSTKEKTEDLIQNTKEAIEKGFEQLGHIVEKKKGNKTVGQNDISLN